MRDEYKTVIRQGRGRDAEGRLNKDGKIIWDESLIMWENNDVSWMGDEEARWKGG